MLIAVERNVRAAPTDLAGFFVNAAHLLPTIPLGGVSPHCEDQVKRTDARIDHAAALAAISLSRPLFHICSAILSYTLARDSMTAFVTRRVA